MAIEVPRLLVEFILLGPEQDRRQIQDSPILGDVWIEFGRQPASSLELLITPYKGQSPAEVADALASRDEIQDADIAYLQGIVAARLSFEDTLRYVVPMTRWFSDKNLPNTIAEYLRKPRKLTQDIAAVLEAARKWTRRESPTGMEAIEARQRYAALAGLILWARTQQGPPDQKSDELIRRIVQPEVAGAAATLLKQVFAAFDGKGVKRDSVWTISLNRRATTALTRSVPAVKGDAARTLFTVDCSEITWAVIDSGVDAAHPAFRAAGAKESRIRRSFDFTAIRQIISLDNRRNDKRRRRVDALLQRPLKHAGTRKEIDADLQRLADNAREGAPIDWERVERLVEIDPAKDPPGANHGTHVAGIIGASLDGGPRTTRKRTPKSGESSPEAANGMCPDINIYDFRVLAPSLLETEFAIIAALQYIRYVNGRNSYITIHGANLSLSIPHDVRNYACGYTPVCNECERLVNSGVVVVAAAGNRGYQNFETKDGLYEGYAAFSITDPGNADGVITVGATHRFWPHTYGVSYFSSRGPTGDGRLKPDLVAPGERIRAPLPGGEWGDLDGTSMSAPHVSGAAAMLMGRYSELIGQPRRIKQVLCDSATDLGRERTFQGHGMLDVLRAFQSV